LDSDAVGEVELEGGVLVIKRIHVVLKLKCESKHEETAQRVHGFYAEKCPVYLSLRAAIGITTELRCEPLPV
jgi:organic hydroperoxide reductase OsmC/OhrA